MMNSKLTFIKNKILAIPFMTIMGILFFADLMTIEYFESPIYTLLQYIILLVLLFYTWKKKDIVKKTDLFFIFMIMMVGIFIVISSFLGDVPGYYLRAAVYYATFLVVMSVFLLETRYIQEIKNVFIGGKWYLIAVLIVTDLLMILWPDKFYNISGSCIGTTLVGNKFNVSYTHMMFMFVSVFLEDNIQYRNRKAFIYSLIVAVICKLCDCNTGVLGCVLFAVLYFMPNRVKKILSKPGVVIAIFFLNAFGLLVLKDILAIKPIEFIITEILHRDVSLTGRMSVYPCVYDLISERPLLGYGYETLIVKQTTLGIANAQNGLLHFVICYGCLTAVFLMFSIFISTHKNNVNNLQNVDGKNWIVLVMIYVYMFMGIVEITYNKHFFFYIIFLYACSCMKDAKEIQ